MVSSIIGWIIFGLIIGAIARFILPGKQSMSMIVTTLLGIAGSFAGGALSHLLFGGGAGWGEPSGWIMSILGAVILLAIYSYAMARKAA